jgi:hypothetical protein
MKSFFDKLPHYAKLVEAVTFIVLILGTQALSVVGHVLPPQVALWVSTGLGAVGLFHVWLVKMEPLLEGKQDLGTVVAEAQSVGELVSDEVKLVQDARHGGVTDPADPAPVK